MIDKLLDEEVWSNLESHLIEMKASGTLRAPNISIGRGLPLSSWTDAVRIFLLCLAKGESVLDHKDFKNYETYFTPEVSVPDAKKLIEDNIEFYREELIYLTVYTNGTYGYRANLTEYFNQQKDQSILFDFYKESLLINADMKRKDDFVKKIISLID